VRCQAFSRHDVCVLISRTTPQARNHKTTTRVNLTHPEHRDQPTIATPDSRDKNFTMASTRPIERTEPVVVPRGQIPSPVRSRLPAPLKVAILIVLNFGFRGLLWTFTETLLNQELGAVSKVPEVDFWSQYSVSVRACMTAAMNIMTWYFNYDCKTRNFHVCRKKR
jgi:hypothetical protein